MTNFSSKIISPSLPRGECNIHLIRKVRTKEVNTIFFQSFYFWSLITFNLNSDKIINYQWIFTSTTFLNCVCSNQMFWYSFIIFQNKKMLLTFVHFSNFIVTRVTKMYGLYGFFIFSKKYLRNLRIKSQIVRSFRIFRPENVIFFDFDLIKS